jgi:acyl carrier protein
MDDIGERVRDAIVSVLKIDSDRVSEAARFVEDLGATSLDVVEIIMALEDQFSIEIKYLIPTPRTSAR